MVCLWYDALHSNHAGEKSRTAGRVVADLCMHCCCGGNHLRPENLLGGLSAGKG